MALVKHKSVGEIARDLCDRLWETGDIDYGDCEEAVSDGYIAGYDDCMREHRLGVYALPANVG